MEVGFNIQRSDRTVGEVEYRENDKRERERKSDRGSEKKREVEYNHLKSNNKPSKTAIKIRVGS